jgi:HlyD family secretion protein
VIADRELVAAQNSFQAANARYDQAAAQVEQARANEQSSDQSGLAEAQAMVREAQAQIGQNEAAIRLAQANLDHTMIRSPIDGVVVSRNVDVGQTVAASLQTPVLFTIAGDLSRMQVTANIDQADIGAINTASQVNFTVDTYASENFTGAIQQIRLSPQDVDNVVTYNVVIDVANPQLRLKPGMTANLVITYAERDDVLRIPSAALGFTPAGVTKDQIRDLLGELPETTSKNAEAANLQSQSHIVWVLGTDHKPQARKITLGITDGINTEVAAGDLEENEMIITSQASNSRPLN